MRILSAVALLAGITAAAPGCGAPENLAQAADAAQSALASMPGVSDAWVYHENTYAQGVAVNIAVDVSTATREQIADVADHVDANRFGLIANYAQNVEFWVTPNRAVTLQRHNQLDPAQVADDTVRLRQIAAGTDGRIDWFRSDDGTVNQLSFDQTHSAGSTILDAVRSAAGGSGPSVSVSPVSPSRQTPRLVVHFPIDPTEQTAVFNVVNSVPAEVRGLRLDAAGLQALEVVAANPATAEQDLAKVITASGAVSARPMWLAWYYPTFAGGAPAYGGVVQTGGCAQGPAAAVTTVTQRTGDQVSSLQSRLQTAIDNCGASAPRPAQSQRTPPPAPAQSSPVIDVVAPDRKQSSSDATTTPRPTRTPCSLGTGCAPTTTTISASGGDRPGSSRSGATTPAPRPMVPPPSDLPLPLPVGAADPGADSDSGSGSGSGSGTSVGSGASSQRTPSPSGTGHLAGR
ncbi:hypothetical protein [Candidatus Mycolicibacterium alkanivorans]|uniref:Uncharacterized protein n=1 Tax=Candidatus Mycolicibacterium alkanivorans TaxID=2954114 RepID=A0ABS9YYP4_9MYCO|nr:hypothetical protein [Candidatus Mycolicibacterium alkanivorans]MCI4676349.1 hypothetical protein [Candidatus Mycolicibacterium alkanivorans]